jgi:hypothetical protein
MPNKVLFFFAFAMIIMTSCSPRLTPFTQKLYKENGWSERDLQSVQFYLSQDIVLTRQMRDGESAIKDGKVKVVAGREIEEIRFPKGTPGVLLFIPKVNRFAISFEEGGDDKYIMFGPNQRYSGKYMMLAADWDKNYGTVSYNDRVYRTDNESAYAALLIDLKAIRRTTIKKKTAKGRTVN